MRYGISAAILVVHEGRLLLVNHREAGRYDFWLPPREPGEEFLVDARFFAREEVQDLDVYHGILKDRFWSDLEAGDGFTRYLGLEEIRF